MSQITVWQGGFLAIGSSEKKDFPDMTREKLKLSIGNTNKYHSPNNIIALTNIPLGWLPYVAAAAFLLSLPVLSKHRDVLSHIVVLHSCLGPNKWNQRTQQNYLQSILLTTWKYAKGCHNSTQLAANISQKQLGDSFSSCSDYGHSYLRNVFAVP